MTALAFQDFGFEGQTVRAMDRAGQPWFVAQDVCACLEIGNHRDALSRLDSDEKGVVTADTLGGAQEMLIVSESGVYSLVFRSRKDAAKRFRKWVTGEVLPALRLNGHYTMPDNDMAEDMFPLDQPDDIERARVKLALVREVRQVYGRLSARRIWDDIGLPHIEKKTPMAVEYTPEEMNPVIREWFDERCLLDPSARTNSTDLYKDFKEWCREHGHVPWRQTPFGRQLSKLGLRTHRSGVCWRIGVRLQD